MKARLLLSILAGLATCGFASAQTNLLESTIFNFGSGTANALPTTTAPANVAVAKFDPSLGTLNSVSLTLQASGTVFATEFNSTSVNQNYSNSWATLNFGVKGPDGSTISIHPTTGLPGFAGTAAPYAIQITGSSPFSLSPASVYASSSNLGAYEAPGGGFFTLSFNSDGVPDGPISSSIQAPSGVSTSGDATVQGTVTVTYSYTPIPEPATYAGLLGAAALGLVIRRRKQVVV
jgi:hypothetical protein